MRCPECEEPMEWSVENRDIMIYECKNKDCRLIEVKLKATQEEIRSWLDS